MTRNDGVKITKYMTLYRLEGQRHWLPFQLDFTIEQLEDAKDLGRKALEQHIKETKNDIC